MQVDKDIARRAGPRVAPEFKIWEEIVSGIQEILVLVVIGLAIFFGPRIMNREQTRRVNRPVFAKPLWRLSGRLRLAILATVVWPLGAAGYFRPWQRDLLPFLYLALGPIMLAWGIFWVLTGYKRHRR